MSATPSGRVTVHGKQLMLDGMHLADCRDEVAALALRDSLDFFGVHASHLPDEASRHVFALVG